MQLERSLKEKAKFDYFTIKNAFKSFDPEGKGNIDRLVYSKYNLTVVNLFAGVKLGIFLGQGSNPQKAHLKFLMRI